MNNPQQGFNEAFEKLLPVAQQMQQQFQQQMQQAMNVFGQVGQSMPTSGLGATPPVPLDAIQPFMSSVMGAFQQALSQIPVHSLGQVQN